MGWQVGKPERREQTPEDNQGSTAAYAPTAVGVALLIGAVLLILTTGVPVSGIGLVIGGAACLGWGLPQVLNRHRDQSLPAVEDNKERELLSAIRDNDGSITPAEAAMETSLTVREADEMLSEFANGGHLKLESRDGALYYLLAPLQRQAGATRLESTQIRPATAQILLAAGFSL